MRHALTAMMLLSGMVAFAADETPAVGSPYYPLKPGTKWTYVVASQKERFSIVVDEHKTKIGEYATSFVLRASIGDKPVTEEYVVPTAKGVIRIQTGTEIILPELPILQKEMKAEDKWTAKFKVGSARGDEIQADYVVAEDEVTVPAGKFKAIKILCTVTEKAMVVKSTVWYAKEVGRVRQEINYGDSKIELELEKVEAKK